MLITRLVRALLEGRGRKNTSAIGCPSGVHPAPAGHSEAINKPDHNIARAQVAAEFLRGCGLEIGAMHDPTIVPEGVVVKYVDYKTPEANQERFPELKHRKMVNPDFIEDGFRLPSIPDYSQDFIIANHVLEHADNVLEVLIRWARTLRPGGNLFITVPIAERCFDRGRTETSLAHFIDDFESCRNGDVERFRRNTLEHYIEWISISERAGSPQAEQVDAALFREEILEEARKRQAIGTDIHFHTFSIPSFMQLLDYFCSVFARNFMVVCVLESGAEVIAVVSRRSR